MGYPVAMPDDTDHAATNATPPDKSTGDVGTATDAAKTTPVPESGGPKGLDPTRYGDWERNGRCIDF